MRGWRNGRLATLRWWCLQERGGSNPLPRTNQFLKVAFINIFWYN